MRARATASLSLPLFVSSLSCPSLDRHAPQRQPVGGPRSAGIDHRPLRPQHRPKPVLGIDVAVYPDLPGIDHDPVGTPPGELCRARGFQAVRHRPLGQDASRKLEIIRRTLGLADISLPSFAFFFSRVFRQASTARGNPLRQTASCKSIALGVQSPFFTTYVRDVLQR